jgi:hypothetical protein
MDNRSFGYEFTDPDSDIYYGWLDGKPQQIDRLRPLETPLHFNSWFIDECANNPAIDCTGLYTNGWEL